MREERAEPLGVFARTRQHIQVGLYLGDSLQLIVECGSKAVHFERLLMKTDIELPKHGQRRFRHGAPG